MGKPEFARPPGLSAIDFPGRRQSDYPRQSNQNGAPAGGFIAAKFEDERSRPLGR